MCFPNNMSGISMPGWYLLVFVGTAWYCLVLVDTTPYLLVLLGTFWYFIACTMVRERWMGLSNNGRGIPMLMPVEAWCQRWLLVADFLGFFWPCYNFVEKPSLLKLLGDTCPQN